MLIDTHCHLDFKKFDNDRTDVLARAQQAGVSRIILPGLNLDSSQTVVKLAESHESLYAAVGFHPTEAGNFYQEVLSELISLSKNPKVIAVGEIGLDYYWDTEAHEIQKNVLRAHLDLAARLGLPVILHSREKSDMTEGECAEDMIEILQAWVQKLQYEKNPLAERPGVLHSFSGSRSVAERAIALNFFIGVTGPVTYRQDRQALISSLPVERLVIETDSPFLSPAPKRGKRNEPANVSLIADKIATLHSCTFEDIANITTSNARRLFAWED